MKNTHTEHLSIDRTPTVLPAFADLLPPLPEEQLSILEADILQNGCYSPIIVNEDLVVIDGHNRLSICQKHGLPYRMAVFSFEDDLEAKQWALDTQKGRRNLEKWELGKIALKLKPEIEARAAKKKEAAMAEARKANPNNAGEQFSATLPATVAPPVDTRKELAGTVGLGERTMGKVMQIDEHAPAPIKEALDKKEISVNKGYNITKRIKELPEEEQEQAAVAAIEYEKAKKELERSDAEIDRKGAIAKQFCTAFEKSVMLEPTEENVKIWVEFTRMFPSEMESMAEESRQLADTYNTIANLLVEKVIPQDWRTMDKSKEQ